MKQVYLCDSCSNYFDANEITVSEHEKWCFKAKEREIQRRKDREATGQLTISQIIGKCEKLPNLPVITFLVGEKYPFWAGDHKEFYEKRTNGYIGKYPYDTDSYRGYYNELAIEVSDVEMNLEDFLEKMRQSLRRIYYGYKGGEYGMYDDTFVWVAENGVDTNLAVVDIRQSDDEKNINLVIKYLD